jgi:hypothetical protein
LRRGNNPNDIKAGVRTAKIMASHRDGIPPTAR